MVNRLMKIMCCVVVVLALAVTGCQRKTKQVKGPGQPPLTYTPAAETISVTNSYAPRAIAATGGYETWLNTPEIDYDCVVAFYKPDNSFYLTQQHYNIYPWSNSIRITSPEPQGKIVWQLSNGNFTVPANAKLIDTLALPMNKRDFADAILNITTASVRLLDKSSDFTRSDEPVKLQGRWYYQIERTASAIAAQQLNDPNFVEPPQYNKRWSKAIFYQDTESANIDMLWLTDFGNNQFYLARAYDYRPTTKDGVQIPSKIEIFTTNEKGVIQQRLVKIDLK